MYWLDSRLLAAGDCFAQRFSVAGAFTYRLVLGPPLFPNAESIGANAYAIEVKSAPKGAKPTQQNILVTRSNNRLIADPAAVSIQQGDTLLWYTVDSSINGFSVSGGDSSFRFDSANITGEAFYTHVFGAPGEYLWSDAIGSSVKGTVKVDQLPVQTPADRQRFLEALKKATVIDISGNDVRPDRVEIVVGQTVFWHIQNASGITVISVNPQPLPPS